MNTNTDKTEAYSTDDLEVIKKITTTCKDLLKDEKVITFIKRHNQMFLSMSENISVRINVSKLETTK